MGGSRLLCSIISAIGIGEESMKTSVVVPTFNRPLN
jgi:hypothetical protein